MVTWCETDEQPDGHLLLIKLRQALADACMSLDAVNLPLPGPSKQLMLDSLAKQLKIIHDVIPVALRALP